MSQSITVLKSSDGLRKMLIISSNAYQDREDEIVREKALKEYVEQFEPNDLLVWHGGDPVGRIIGAEMEGPFLIEIAEELPDQAVNLAKPNEQPILSTVKAVWDVFESASEEWGASIGFKYIRGDKDDGVYERIIKVETSVLPVQYAANPYTLSEVIYGEIA